MDDILRVASFQDLDPAREAMVITAVYHRLANDIADPLRSIVNWYGFSTWSSRTIGEDLDLSADSPFLDKMRAKLNVPKRFSRQFRRLMVLLLGPSYRLGLALANRSIFLETGSVAVNLQAANLQQINLQATDSTPPQNLGFSYRLRDPDPATDGASAEEPSTDEASTVEVRLNFVSALLGRANEEYLDYAATFLAEAAQTTDIDRHAELILGANVALSAFEQARAQVMLELVLHRPCRWLLLASWRSLLSAVTGRPFRRLVLYTAPHEQMPWPVRQFEDLWVKFHTRFVMTLRTPVSEIRLGRPLRPPPGCDPEKAFAPIRDDRVRRLVETFVPDPERKMAGATNWLDYADRMRFIVAYFRTYLSIGELLDPPFSETVLDQLYEEAKAGSVPDPVYCEWFQRRETKYRDKANRPGVKGWLVRRFYRPPMAFDPDAVELARLDLRTLLEAHTISPKTP
jgi:hypothetical protein